MLSRTLSLLNRPLPDRRVKLLVVGMGLGFWLCWGTSMFILVDGHPLVGIENCTEIDGTGVFWECSTDKLHTLVATMVNGLIVITLAMPVFVVASNIDPTVLPLALPGIMFNVLGLPAGLFVLVRCLRRLWEHLLIRS